MVELFTHENKNLMLSPVLHKIRIFHIYYLIKAHNVSTFSDAHAEELKMNLML